MRSMHPVLKIAAVITAVQSATVCNNGCSSHGVCDHGSCHCELDWTGADCSFFLASVSNEDDNILSQDSVLTQQNCIDGCSGHGSCLGDVCFCSHGWGGSSCALETSCPNGCSNGGTCHTGACVCKTGFFGATCEDQSCPNDCFGHGSCDKGQCRCETAWTGATCDLQLDSQVLCDPPCQQGAACLKGQCYCPQGFYGTDCSIPVSVEAKKEERKETKDMMGHSMISLARTVLPLFWPVSEITNTKPQNRGPVGLRGHSASDEKAVPAIKPPEPPSGDGTQALELNLESILNDKGKANAIRSIPHSALPMSQLQLPMRKSKALETPHLRNVTQVISDTPEIRPRTSGAPPTDSLLFQKLENVAQLAGDSATQLWRQAQTAKIVSAKDRIQRAIELAHERADEIPGHEFGHYKNKPREAVPNLALLQNTTTATINEAKKVDEDDSPQTKLKGNVQDALALARNVSKRIADNYASTNCDGGCNGHGLCGPNKMCVCQDPWFGEVCDTQRCESDCSARGVCIRQKCICEKGFFGGACQHQRCPDDCSGHGYCLQGACQCLGAATGPSCAALPQDSEVAPVKIPVAQLAMSSSTKEKDAKSGRPAVLTLRGDVSATIQRVKPPAPTPVAAETPLSPSTTTAPLNKASPDGIPVFFKPVIQPTMCAPGYGGSDCQMPLMCPDHTCSGHGNCAQGKCHCTQGFGGDLCTHKLGACQRHCGAQGLCNVNTGMCECHQGWTGPNCELSSQHCPASCSGHGVCLNNQCVCMHGWTGPACNMIMQDSDTVWDVDPKPLSMMVENGINVAGDLSGKPERAIELPRTGELSDKPERATELPLICQSGADCNAHGICVTGKCLCLRGWTGRDCAEGMMTSMQQMSLDIPIVTNAPASPALHADRVDAGILSKIPQQQSLATIATGMMQGSQAKHKEVLVQNLDEPLSARHKHHELRPLPLDDMLFQLQASVSKHFKHLHREVKS